MKELKKEDMCPDLENKTLTDNEVAELYKVCPDRWFLFQVLEKGKEGKAVKLKVTGYSKDKEVLRNLLLDLDDWEHDYIYVFTYSDGRCDLIY